MPDITAIGFDFGLRRIGVATGQSITGTASPLQTVQAQYGKPNWQSITSIIEEWQPQALIVGLPLDLDGKDQAITSVARKFAEELKQRYTIPVYFCHEGFTTKIARQMIFDQGGYRALQETAIDDVAAALILQHWFSIPEQERTAI